MSALLCSTVLATALLAAGPTSDSSLGEVVTAMKRGGDGYRDAKDTFIEWLRADLHEDDGVKATLKLLQLVPPERDPRLARDLVEALPREERMVQVLAALARGKPRAESTQDAAAQAIIQRLGGSQNPAYLTPLLAYLDVLGRRDDSAFGPGYDALVANFAPREPRAVAFLWAHPIPAHGTPRRDVLAKTLRAHRPAGADDHVIDALTGRSVPHRGLAVGLALGRKAPALRAALVASLAETAVRGLEREPWLDPVAHLAALAASEPAALLALVDAVIAGSPDAEAARLALLGLLASRPVALDRDRLNGLVALVAGSDPVYGVFDLLELVDVSPAASRLVAMLAEEARGLAAAYALVGRTPDSLLDELVRRLPRLEPEGRIALLSVLRTRYRGQPWGRALLDLVDAADDEVAQAATSVLVGSTDDLVRARLADLTDDELLRVSSPYFAVERGLRVSWSPTARAAVRGEPLVARVEVRNAGSLPFKWPLDLPFRYSRWELAIGDQALGPLDLTPADEGPAFRVLRPGELGVFQVDLGRALAAFGPGAHEAAVRFTSRARHAPQRHAPDFSRGDVVATIRVDEPRDIRSWLHQPTGVTAWVEAPGDAWRATGWKRWLEGWQAPPPPGEPVGDLDTALELLARKGKLARGESFSLRVESQASPTVAFELDDRGRFVYTQAVEGPEGHAAIQVDAAARKAFFADLRAGRPFDHEPVQRLGRLREPQVTLHLYVAGLNWASGALWLAELEHHPALRAWYDVLVAWRDQATGR